MGGQCTAMDVYLRSLISPLYYVVLIHPTAAVSKSYTQVVLTSNPLQTVVAFNQDQGGPVWYKLRAGCAFRSYDEAYATRLFLATKKRSFNSKQTYLKNLAARRHLPYYSDAIRPPGGTRAYLKKYAPSNYVSVYDRLIRKKSHV